MIAVLLMCIFVSPAVALSSILQEPADSAETSTSTQWLLSYKREGEGYEFFQKNYRLRALLRDGLPHYGVPWYRSSQSNLTLPDGAFHAISALPGSVTVEDNRFVTITGTMPREAPFKGLLWCDTAAEQPTLIFVFMQEGQGRAEGSASLDIYTNRDDPDSPPPSELISSIQAWLKESKITTVTRATVHDAQQQTAALSTSDLSTQ
jgi:hypothetical protein